MSTRWRLAGHSSKKLSLAANYCSQGALSEASAYDLFFRSIVLRKGRTSGRRAAFLLLAFPDGKAYREIGTSRYKAITESHLGGLLNAVQLVS